MNSLEKDVVNVQTSSSDDETTEVSNLLHDDHGNQLSPRSLAIKDGQDRAEKIEDLQTGNDVSTPDEVLYQLGGCGMYQFLVSFTIQAMKIVVCWGMVGNVFISYVPDWRCSNLAPTQVYTGNSTAVNNQNGSESHLVTSTLKDSQSGYDDNNSTAPYWNKQCFRDKDDPCTKIDFTPGINTLVSEFDLVCDKSWVTATIVSIQMAGMCVGSIVSGQLSDLFGRKRPIFAAMAILSLFHLISFFSVNWQMFAVCRFFIGIGSAFYLTIYCTIQSEFNLAKWRSVVIGFPSWAIQASLFALVAWIFPNWKILAMLMSVIALGFMATWFFVPESFRWYVATDRLKEVDALSKTIARWNRHPAPNHEKIRKMLLSTQVEGDQSNKHCLTGLLDLFRLVPLLKLTLPLMISWLTMGFVAYGINFGVKKLSGNIFLNIFLFSIASVPSKLASIYLQNKFGRKVASNIAFIITGTSGLIVGIVHNIDTPHRDTLITTFALIASVGVDGTWGPMQTLTVEVYPTVVRNVGFGLASVLARLGAVLGPQFVYLGEMVPGILYFAVALTCLLSVVSLLCLPETMDSILLDKITEDLERRRRKERNVA